MGKGMTNTMRVVGPAGMGWTGQGRVGLLEQWLEGQAAMGPLSTLERGWQLWS